MHLSWSFFSVSKLAISQVFHLVSLVGASHWLCKPELQSQFCHLLLCDLGRWFITSTFLKLFEKIAEQ